MRKLLLPILIIIGCFAFVTIVLAAECETNCSSVEECADKIKQCQSIWDSVQKAKEPHEASLKKMESDIAAFQAKIASISKEVSKKEKEIDASEEELAEQQSILNKRVRQSYIRSFSTTPFLLLFAKSEDFRTNLRLAAYQQSLAEEDKRVIVDVIGFIKDLEDRKAKLTKEKENLATLTANLNVQAAATRKLVTEASKYQSDLSSKIGSLTARQQQILAEKSGTFQTTVGDVPLADDVASRPDYNPGFSPAFAAFSFGAPHFKGMSQYGAYGRAKKGQNYEQILRAYYGNGIEIKDHNPDAQITVQGYGNYSLEDYAKRIYEMPGSWGDDGGMEALKAQAVAARSYALARGGTICATEACQVFKPGAKGGKWEEAVNATRGKVIYANGSPFSSWYASTSGGYQESYSANGYSTPGFWDTPSGRGGWTGEAYEKVAGSPWFYKGWYRSRSGDSCGRSHPWLTSEEMADILNAWVVLFQGGGDAGRVGPEGSCWGGNPYNKGDLRSIGGFSSVSSASVTYADNGVTANVKFETNKGSVTINGSDFNKAFNLRAPGRISLKSGLYNIEKK